MRHIIEKILKESINTKVINLILNNLKSGRINPPYFKNLEDLGLSEEEIKLTLEEYTGGKIDGKVIYNPKYGKEIYDEWGDGNWALRQYNKFGEITRIEQYDGYWQNRKYDERNNQIFYEDSNGNWFKVRYDDYDNMIYHENSRGTWEKKEYTKDGKLIYHETSDEGVKLDKR